MRCTMIAEKTVGSQASSPGQRGPFAVLLWNDCLVAGILFYTALAISASPSFGASARQNGHDKRLLFACHAAGAV